MRTDTPAQARGRRLGRRVGWITFSIITATFTAVCAIQIMVQAFAPDGGTAPAECRSGVQSLIAAVERARRAAGDSDGGEKDALDEFRNALAPEWDNRGALGVLCRGTPTAEQALKEVDLLRYAEEAVVRYEVMDLSRRRKRVRVLDARLAAEQRSH